MDEITYFRCNSGYVGLDTKDVKRLEHFDREFLGFVFAGILKESERWEYINDCLRNEGITDEHIYITGRSTFAV